MLLPGPASIENFPGLPGSIKSDLPGDTIQNPNISAYYSQFTRDGITHYYKDVFSKLLLGFSLPIISINHPPEAAYQYVRDQQRSTFLEEYVFPLRESIFVNGYETRVENYMKGRFEDDKYVGHYLRFGSNYYSSKTTLRFYSSNLIPRIFVYIEIWVALYCLYYLLKRVARE